MALNQNGRLIRMTKGPLGPDEVVMTGFSGREAISRLFSFQLEFISTDLDLKPGKIIGNDVTIELDRRDVHGVPLTPRWFHGYISRFAAGSVVRKEPGVHKYRQYRAEMVPWLWFLTQTARCYLFFPEKEDKSIFEVIEAVFARAKSELHVDPVIDLKGINDLKKRMVKHCVQYRETDFNFVSRTMERYGVFYYFKFEDGKHTLVLDLKKNYPKCEEAEVFFPGVTGGQSAVDHITDWQHDYEFVSGKWSHTDYNFEKPSTSLGVNAPKLPSIDLAHNDKYEIYDYPGEYVVKGDGEADAKIRQEEEEIPHSVVNGASLCRTFAAGHKFKLTAHHDDDAVSEQGKSYLLTSVEQNASQPADDTGDEGPELYHNRFTCIPDTVQYRPERITPRPQISGVQTAVVVGPEEIHTDKYGRVKVQFHWDREGKKDGNSSCWIRVSQNWGGKNWGGMFIPHVGQEVIVDFEEGDPDRPLVTGRVYNAEVMPPLELPANKTKNAIRDHGGNEIVMEGDKGKEQLKMFSPYGNTTLSLGAPASPPGIKAWTDFNWTGFAGGDYEWTVKGNSTTQVAGCLFQHVVGFQEETTAGWKTEHTVGLHTEVAMIGKVEMMLGWKKEIDPVGHKKAKKEELELIGKIDQKIAFERVKIADLYRLVTKRRDEIGTLAQHIKATMDLRVGELNQKIDGAVTETMASVDKKIKGNQKVTTGSYALHSKGYVTIESTGAGMRLQSSGTMVLKNGGMKIQGKFVDIKDGTLKVI